MEYFGFFLLLLLLFALCYIWAMMPCTDRKTAARDFLNDNYLYFGGGDFSEFVSFCREKGCSPAFPITVSQDRKLCVARGGCENMVLEDLIKNNIYTLEKAMELIPPETRCLLEVSADKSFPEGKLLIHFIRDCKQKTAVISESDFCLNYIAREENSIIRGAVSRGKKGSYYLKNYHSRPDIIICPADCDTLSVALCKNIFRVPVIPLTDKEVKDSTYKNAIYTEVKNG